MSRRILVAGVGNVFFGDDGFGVEVVRRLAERPLPPGVTAVDFGIRAMHLAFELFSTPDLLVLVDATVRNGAPGTLYLIDPEHETCRLADTQPDGHSMNPFAVLATLRAMGGVLPRTRIIGCEPAELGHTVRLSETVERSIEPAIGMIRRLIDSEVTIHEATL
jgi:hydrogenase maturation protease